MSETNSRDEFISDAEFIDHETSPYVHHAMRKPKRKRPLLTVTSVFAAILLGVIGYFIVSHFNSTGDLQKTQGKVAMSTNELRAIVLAKHLTVYWAGPTAGDKYALIASKAGSTFVRYLPNGNGINDSTTSFRVIATYTLKNAFAITQSAGGVSGNVGFVNVDGNAVFYVKTRPTNVYMGIKGQDRQIEIFDPSIDQSLGLSLIHNQILQIV